MTFKSAIAGMTPPDKPAPRKVSSYNGSGEAVDARIRAQAAKAAQAAQDDEGDEPERPPRIYDAFDLMEMHMADPRYVCKPWISEGVTLVVGRPKLGKTTMLRQLVHAANTGGLFLGSPCECSEVLFLSLEEGERMMRKKLRDMGVPFKSLKGVSIAFEWPQASEGVTKMREWLKARKTDRLPLIVVDALVRFRLPPSDRGNAYVEDYNAVRLLSELCKEFPGLCILVLHHVRKSISDDPVSLISGTYGLTAAIDSYLIMLKEGQQYRLHAGGRLWMGESADFELKREGGAWTLAGEWDTATNELPPKQRAVMDELRRGAQTNKSLCELTNQSPSAMSHLLGTLSTMGLVSRIANGWEIVR